MKMNLAAFIVFILCVHIVAYQKWNYPESGMKSQCSIMFENSLPPKLNTKPNWKCEPKQINLKRQWHFNLLLWDFELFITTPVYGTHEHFAL